MWIKENGTWSRQTNILSSDEFKPTLQRLQTYAKCLNASTYSVTNQLHDIYSIVNYQHGFYVENITGSPIVVSQIRIEPGRIYNLSLLVTRNTIVNNINDGLITTDGNGLSNMTIRTAIANGYIKAANSLLFDDPNGFYYWENYSIAGTSGIGIILTQDYTEDDVYLIFANDERNSGWSLTTIWTPEKLLKKLLNNFRLVDVASTTNIDLSNQWFELIIDDVTVNSQMQILLKDQTNAYENGVYVLQNNYLVHSTIFDSIDELQYFSAFVKNGTINKEQQFFLDRLPNGVFPITDFGTTGMDLHFVPGFNYAIRNRVDYKLLQNNTIQDSAVFEEKNPILFGYETFNYSYVLYDNDYRISKGGDFIQITNLTTNDVTLVGLVDNSTMMDLTSIRLNALNVFRKTDDDKFVFINNENNTRVVYVFDPLTHVSVAVYSDAKVYDASLYADILYATVDTSSNSVRNSKIVKYDTFGMTVLDTFYFNIFLQETQVFIPSVNFEWFFFNDQDNVYIFNKTHGQNILVESRSKYLTLNLNYAVSTNSGTSGTSGLLPEIDLLISYIEQNQLTPVRYRKAISSLSDYSEWLSEAYLENGTNGIDSEFVIKSNFSKHEIGDWKIADQALYLKNVNILSGTNGIDLIPKISNTTGRYFDGKNDFVQFVNLDFANVQDFSIEFEVIPETLINNTRLFYFATPIDVNNLFSGLEFITLDFNTGKPKFVYYDTSNNITIDSTIDLTIGVLTRVTLTAEFSATQNNQYIYTIRMWFNGVVAGSASGIFTKTISQLGSLTSCYIGKTDNNLQPLFRGEVREFRISNIVLNPAQIASRDRAIVKTDLTYPNLLYYWNLYDKTSKIVDQINRQNGIFNGGLVFDPDLFKILTPQQILFSQNSKYLYLLSSLKTYDIGGTAGTSGLTQSRLFQIDLRTEDLNLLYETNNFVKSIYVENNLFYWLEDNKIKLYDIYGNTVEVTISIDYNNVLDFTVVNDKIFYVDIFNNIYDENNINVTGLNSVPNADQIIYVYGLYQTYKNINWYNVYFLTTDNKIEIISSTFAPIGNIIGSTFQKIGNYPFYDKTTYKKIISNFGYTFAITNDDKIVSIVGSVVVDLDPNQQYWSYQLKSLFAISLPAFDYLYVGSIDTDNNVQIWRYELLTDKIVLMQYQTNSIFESESDLDMIVTQDTSGKYLTIIKPDKLTFRRFKIEDIYLRLNYLELDIEANLNGTLSELSDISLNQFYYTIFRNDLLWVGRIIRYVDVTYWQLDIQYDYQADTLFVGDFGVAFKENASTSGHSLDLLQTLVKWDFKNINLVIDKNINDNNFISPRWLGVAYIVGQTGGVLITRDYGSTWQAVSTDLPDDLYSICNIDSEQALIVGQNSTILQTFSAGQFYDKINVDPTLTSNRDFTNVLIYNDSNALVVGKGGLILHMVLDNITRNWKISSNVVNNSDLIIVTNSDLESIIKPILKQDNEKNTLLTNYSKIIQITSNSFWLLGDRGLFTHLTLNFVNDQIRPVFEFYQALNFAANTVDAIDTVDYDDGLDKLFFISSDSVYAFNVQGAVAVPNSNLKNVNVNFISSVDFTLTNIAIKKNYNDRPIRYEQIYLSGTLNNINVADLQYQDYTNDVFKTSRPLTVSKVDPILNDYFKPRMLITDYYLARKINILLDESNFITPSVNVDKSIFDCYKFDPGEWIEFAPYDRNKNPNYLAIQDWYYTTRRIMQTDANGDALSGVVKSFPYNKRFTAVSDMTNYQTVQDSLQYFTIGAVIRNINEYTSATFAVNFPERNAHTVIHAPSNLIVAPSDVIEVKIARIQYGDNNLPFEKILMDEVFIVKHVENDNTLVLWDLLDPQILADSQFGLVNDYALSASTSGYGSWKIYINNLNYFISDAGVDIQPLLALKETINKHLVGQVYDMNIEVENILPISASVTLNNRYANLETIVSINLNTGFYTYDVVYDSSVVYGPNYNLLNFLQNLDSSIDASYELKNLTMFIASLNGLSGVNELSVSRNLISAGSDYIETLLQYLPGTWVDITLGDTTVKRVRIDKVDQTTFTSGVDRIILHTDTDLSSRFLDAAGFVLTIRPRTSLGEISKDLEFTDNINMPRPITDGEFGTSSFEFSNQNFGSYRYGYYSFVQTASSYARWLMNDPLVKSLISASVWLDHENDLRLNVYSWNTDPNFAFRPLDLYEVGIDFILKKAITVLDTNWDFNDNFFGLKEIDFTKYNFYLTDKLDLTIVNQKYPWLLNANIRNAVIGEEDFTVQHNDSVTGELITTTVKRLRWYTGQWYCGTWEDGVWYSGDAYQITWLRGDWYSYAVNDVFNIWTIDTTNNDATNSNWFSGIFGSGTWHNGTWYNGTWQSGVHITGNWFGGVWLNGEWDNGLFSGGLWYDGTWLNGVFNSNNLAATWFNGTWLGGDFENGTWKNGIWDQGAGKKSRFGTKSTTVQPAIWEFGLWKNGEFHSYLNVNSNNASIASLQYRSSVWKNGIWQGGNWYGGTWERGLWKNGIWHYGLWRSLLQLESVQRITVSMINEPVTITTWLKFSAPHFYKTTSAHLDFNNQTTLDNKVLNTVTVLGVPDTSSGDLPLLIKGDSSQDQQNGLGWNSFPIQHVVKIEDDYNLSIRYLPTGQSSYIGKDLVGDTIFIDSGTSGTAGTSSTSGFCADRNLILPTVPEIEIYEFINVYTAGPFAVSHWQDGTFKAGIWENGYWNSGRWEGGIWLNGVFERGLFGAT